jgi:hypothetical protein
VKAREVNRLVKQETSPRLDPVPPLKISPDRFSQIGKVHRAVQLKSRPLAHIHKHPRGNRLFPAASWATQDNRTALCECETDIVDLGRLHKGVLDRLCLAPGEPTEPDHLYLADKQDISVVATSVAFPGQAVCFAQVLIPQRSLAGTRDRLGRRISRSNAVAFRLYRPVARASGLSVACRGFPAADAGRSAPWRF